MILAEIQAQLDPLFQRVVDTNQQLKKHLQHAVNLLSQTNHVQEDAVWRLRKLVLQLRLDQEDVLRVIVRLHHNLALIIGIDPKNSESNNLERLKQLIGKENIKHLLLNLGYWVIKLSQSPSLKKETTQLRQPLQEKNTVSNTFEEEDQEETPNLTEMALSLQPGMPYWEACEHELSLAVELQAYFQFSIEQLTEALQAYGGIPKYGLIYDYIAALQGPVSNFSLIWQHNLSYLNHLILQLKMPVINQQQQALAPQEKQMLLAAMDKLLKLNQDEQAIYAVQSSPIHYPSQAYQVAKPQPKVGSYSEKNLAKANKLDSERLEKEKLEKASQIRRTMSFFQ